MKLSDKLKVELTDVETKAEALELFIMSDIYDNLRKFQRIALAAQLMRMKYIDVLQERIRDLQDHGE